MDVNNKKQNPILYVFLGVFVLGMLLASSSTSPLYPYYYGGDSAIFSLIGKGILSGKIPYVDLFDHKGPIIFFIEALGYGIAGRVGIFLLQCVFGCANLVFIYKTWMLVRGKKGLLFALIAVYSVFFYTFEMGNLTEEYSLPFISGCLFLLVKYAMRAKEDEKHPYIYSLCYGICIGILAFIRVNNAVAICAGVLAVAIYLIYKKNYKNLILNILFGFLGVVIVALPVTAYFAENSALYDMIYATFIHNFKYVGSSTRRALGENILESIALYLPIIVSMVCMLPKFIKKEEQKTIEFVDVLIGCMVVFNLLCQLISNSYAHYFAIYVPVFALVLGRYWNFNIKSVKMALLALCVLLNAFLAAKGIAAVIYNSWLTPDYSMQDKVIKEVVSIIPEEEKDSVIGYNIHARYYMYAEIVPCYKYYTFQKWWSTSNPAINKDFMAWLKDEKPLWVIKHPKENEKELLDILEENYEMKDENKILSVYRLKE